MNTNKNNKVTVVTQKILIPTYLQGSPEELPMFCENRVHQRTSGNPYPNPIINQVFRDIKEDKEYEAVIIENDYLQLSILPELGGRIFSALDKTNNYNFFYKQSVIKPALIGMLGLWISGGAEFNWPTHHRPSTFMPVDYDIEYSDDGSATVWLGEHDPIDRMKGMVGICLYPDKALFESKARIYNRNSTAKSFLWWENIAVPVNKDYQIFFPKDVGHVSFHYKKATGAYPVMDTYYNVQDARGGLDIRFQKNTYQATSYFSAASKYDFFGGYDHLKKTGTMHIANHYISPGKKLFTWGYNQLSDSWENALTDDDGKYAELMAGVYSDNQPDLTWLEPYETKCFSQFWYPFKDIGEPQIANCNAALRFEAKEAFIEFNIYAVKDFIGAKIEVNSGIDHLETDEIDLIAGESHNLQLPTDKDYSGTEIEVKLKDSAGNVILYYKQEKNDGYEVPEPIKDVASPYELETAQDCALAGLHIEQYRDPCIKAFVYYKEGLEKDPENFDCNNLLGVYLLNRYKYSEAEKYLRKAIEILTRWNPNPRNTQPYFNLGLALKYQGKLDEAYSMFSKAAWHFNLKSQASYCMAQIDCIYGNYEEAKNHLKESLELNHNNLKARNLYCSVLRETGELENAKKVVAETLAIDSLDYWAQNENRILNGLPFDTMFSKMKSNPQQTCLDIAYDYMEAGQYNKAKEMLMSLTEFLDDFIEINPIIYYSIGYFIKEIHTDGINEAKKYYSKAMMLDSKYCFPSRKEEMDILINAIDTYPKDSKALYYLGNLYYSKEHYEKAEICWEKAYEIDPSNYILLRNLAMAYYNKDNGNEKVMQLLKNALEIKKLDLQLSYEINYIADKQGIDLEERRDIINGQQQIVNRRDDIYLQKVKLENDCGKWKEALKLLESHTFVPCEGGEHTIIEQYAFAHHAIGRKALFENDIQMAISHFKAAQIYPVNLGGGIWHDVMKVPHIYYEALCNKRMGKDEEAQALFSKIIDIPDTYFTKMYLPSFKYYKALSYEALGEKDSKDMLIDSFYKECVAGLAKEDYGYFKPTPFFITYLEKPETTRKIHYLYLLSLCYLAKKDTKNAKVTLSELINTSRYHQMGNLEYDELDDRGKTVKNIYRK